MIDDEHVINEYNILTPEIDNYFNNFNNIQSEIGNKSLNEILEDIEKNIIIDALKKNSANISKTAKELGIKRQTLQHKLKKYTL